MRPQAQSVLNKEASWSSDDQVPNCQAAKTFADCWISRGAERFREKRSSNSSGKAGFFPYSSGRDPCGLWHNACCQSSRPSDLRKAGFERTTRSAPPRDFLRKGCKPHNIHAEGAGQ